MRDRTSQAAMRTQPGFGLETFSTDQLDSIHHATLKVLRHTGIKVRSNEAVEILHGAGAVVDDLHGDRIVKIPPHVVDDCLQCAPSSPRYYAREMENDFVVEPGRITFTSGGACVHVIDPVTRRHRRSVKKDNEQIALICDSVDEIGVFERPCIASDLQPQTHPVRTLEAIIHNTSKHTFIGPETAGNLRAMVEVASACVGGRDKFKKRPIFTASVCPTSPLMLLRDCCEIVIEAARQGVGLIIIPMALAGATSTVTLAGTLVTTNAEILGALVLAQLTQRGTPCTYANTSTIMDLRTGVGAVGAPELALVAAGTARLAEYYRLPSLVGGAMSDSKIPDAQAAYETSVSALTAALAGANIIFGAGALDQLLTFDYAKLIMDIELMRMVLHVVKGIEITNETMALDVIHHMGPGGELLTHDHTYAHMRAISQNEIFDRGARDAWIKGGEKDATHRAYEKVQSILGHHKPRPLPEGAAEAMEAVIKEYEAELGPKQKQT